jgi:ABC-2 type transport system ATP-binding protein
MQQKIQFIATVLHEPELIILDEPFSGLDPVNVQTLLEVIAELKEKGKTIIFSTHLMQTAERLCDDIILINKSQKVLGGTLRQIKEGFGRSTLMIRCQGGDAILNDRLLVAKVINHSDEKEVWLAEGVSSQTLLKKLIDSGVDIGKFEQIEPSLNEIFIDKVMKLNA